MIGAVPLLPAPFHVPVLPGNAVITFVHEGGPLGEGLTCGCAMWKVVHSLQVHELLTSPNLGPPASGLLVSLAFDFSHCLGFCESVQASLIACSLEEKL